MNWEIGIDMYTPPCVKQTTRTYCTHRELYPVLRRDLDGKEIQGKRYPYGRATVLYSRD